MEPFAENVLVFLSSLIALLILLHICSGLADFIKKTS